MIGFFDIGFCYFDIVKVKSLEFIQCVVLGILDLIVLVNNICNFNVFVLFRYCIFVIK